MLSNAHRRITLDAFDITTRTHNGCAVNPFPFDHDVFFMRVGMAIRAILIILRRIIATNERRSMVVNETSILLTLYVFEVLLSKDWELFEFTKLYFIRFVIFIPKTFKSLLYVLNVLKSESWSKKSSRTEAITSHRI